METHFYAFEKLEAWQKATQLVLLIYKTTRHFPDEEKFGLVSQMRRASISICSNIAEGSARFSPKDQAHFTNLSYSSLMEVLNQALLANELGFINLEVTSKIRKYAHDVSYLLNLLYKVQMRRAEGLH